MIKLHLMRVVGVNVCRQRKSDKFNSPSQTCLRFVATLVPASEKPEESERLLTRTAAGHGSGGAMRRPQRVGGEKSASQQVWK